MSHKPDIIPIGNTQVNVGLKDSREFLLQLEFLNQAPAVPAKNLKIEIDKNLNGVSLIDELPQGKHIGEGERFSQTLSFRLDDTNVDQVDIAVTIDYVYDIFDELKQGKERTNGKNTFNYTVSFREISPIENKYRVYAGQQTVKNEDMFFGRKQIIQKLYNIISIPDNDGKYILRGGNGIILYGQRRSGKTSLLYHLKKKIEFETNRTIVVDIGNIRTVLPDDTKVNGNEEKELQERYENMTLGTLYHSIVCGIKNYIYDKKFDIVPNLDFSKLYEDIQKYEKENGTPLFPDVNAFDNANNCQLLFNDFIKKFLKIVNMDDAKNGFKIVILIDEFTYFNTAIRNNKLPRNFMEIWKGIVSDLSITLIVAGQDNMVEFMEDYVNEFSSFHREWLTFLGKDASYEMVTKPIGDERIDAKAAQKLYRITAGSPFLLMHICANLVDWMNENKIQELKESSLDNFLVKKYMKDYDFNESKLFEPQYVDAGRLDLTKNIKQVLGLIARRTSTQSPNQINWNEIEQYTQIQNEALESSDISSWQMEEILKRLVNRQVVERKDGELNSYKIKIPLYREWIMRKGGEEYGFSS